MNKITIIVLLNTILCITIMNFGMDKPQFGPAILPLDTDNLESIPEPLKCTVFAQPDKQHQSATIFDLDLEATIDVGTGITALHSDSQTVYERVIYKDKPNLLACATSTKRYPVFVCVDKNISGETKKVIYRITFVRTNLYNSSIRKIIQFEKPPLVQKIINNKHFPLLTFLCGSIITSIGFILYFNFFMSRT